MKHAKMFLINVVLFFLIAGCRISNPTGGSVNKGLPPFGLQRPIAMKDIPAGTFSMGDSSVGVTPVHQVTLPAFAMQETDVTQEQYQAVTGKNPSSYTTGTDAPLRPVEQVSWYDAVLYCNALSKLSGLDTCYTYTQSNAMDAVCNFTKNGYRLPTEAQWEYACRAGSTTGYWWGPDTNGMGDRVWWSGNSNNTTHPVATKLANAWGLYDMEGNVWQWCNDWYGAYTAEAVTDPTGSATGTSRVLRGSNQDGIGNIYVYSAMRTNASPVSWNFDTGFRVVLPR
jgi:formylglycine-generating enzyme required for sulfatase activity